ncbi:MAG: hypothetical protein F6J90_16695 [Moorea sp. SIOASIH]|uniref:hypothetical protein n=1 Tax=Moorena sp. SIOASIH TaxID=2607817 RepID=UPI0013BCD907|nr:hypothetical protein [Moorena sp. SIOASIH]NEO37877.1 hypothetical protein [Moorena sp. SIOASIH]
MVSRQQLSAVSGQPSAAVSGQWSAVSSCQRSVVSRQLNRNLPQANLGQKATLREQPSTSQPWPKGHATRTTFHNPPLAKRPRYANNLLPPQPSLGQKATLREQHSTFNKPTFNKPTFNLQPSTFNLQP